MNTIMGRSARSTGVVPRPGSALGLLFLVLSLVACSGQAPTSPPPSAVPAAIATPAATIAPTASPTASPTPSPSPTPESTVFGNVEVHFIGATKAVKAPTPPIDGRIVIEPVGGGAEVTQSIPEGGGGFSLTLDPGNYRVNALEFLAPSMSEDVFRMPTGGPAFTITATGCIYIGRISFAYYRLPAGSFDEQSAMISQLFGRDDVTFLFLESGSLVGNKAGVALPEVGERVAGSDGCSVALAKF